MQGFVPSAAYVYVTVLPSSKVTTFGKFNEFHEILLIPLLELVDFYYSRVEDKASLQTFLPTRMLMIGLIAFKS